MSENAEVILMSVTPLRYTISDWHQASRCLSNTCGYLHITVTDFVQNDLLSGLRIAVTHPQFGTLFATVLNASGELVDAEYVSTTESLTVDQILTELAKFGFLIEFNPRDKISTAQIQYLETLQGLHFDKLRKIVVWKDREFCHTSETIVVAFQVSEHPNWLNNLYAAKQSELNAALIDGTAINLSNISDTHQFDWTWLDYVANIADVLADNVPENDDSDTDGQDDQP